MKYLKKGSLTLPVADCYAYRYDYGKGKTVLRVNVNATDATFAELQEFFGEISDFEQWDEDNLETIYTNYGADLDIHYKKPTDEIQPDGSVKTQSVFYEIEVLRDPSLEADMRDLHKENERLKAKVQELLSAIDEIETRNQEKERKIDAMSQKISDLELESMENVEMQAELLYELCLIKIEKGEDGNGVQDIEKID